ncbi:hypothetical protein FOZ62_019925 [Perkinsus olseni]|uniref:PIH1 N-terminal domain-containing protein n=1 Tax=Perkinsus olseni TaxID=32597 RepID=A0A7J6QPP2_PEROL|nr:hypothetical protein FOZ62_019925 [Perkinsus olseni]
MSRNIESADIADEQRHSGSVRARMMRRRTEERNHGAGRVLNASEVSTKATEDSFVCDSAIDAIGIEDESIHVKSFLQRHDDDNYKIVERIGAKEASSLLQFINHYDRWMSACPRCEYVEAPHVKSFLDSTEQQQGIRVPMSIGEKRDDADRKGGRCVVIDVVFNPGVLTKAMDTADGGEYK